jgi:hypothetical protein
MEVFQSQARSWASDPQPEKSGWDSSWDLQLILHSKTPNGQILISGDLLVHARTRAQWRCSTRNEMGTCQLSDLPFQKNFGSQAFLASGGLVPNEEHTQLGTHIIISRRVGQSPATVRPETLARLNLGGAACQCGRPPLQWRGPGRCTSVRGQWFFGFRADHLMGLGNAGPVHSSKFYRHSGSRMAVQCTSQRSRTH